MGGVNSNPFPQHQPAPGMGAPMSIQPVQQPRPAPTFSLDRPAAQPRPNYAQYQAKNSQYGETIDLSLHLSSNPFVPGP